MKKSKLGIASFVMSLCAAIFALITLVVAGFLYNRSHALGEASYPGQTLVGLVIIFLCFLDVAALGIGIASLFQKDASKTWDHWSLHVGWNSSFGDGGHGSRICDEDAWFIRYLHDPGAP